MEGQSGGLHGLGRTLGYIQIVTTKLLAKSVLVFGIGAILELIAPNILKPSVIFGTFSGRHEQAELDASRRAQVQTAREVAIAQAAAQSAYQQELLIQQHQQQQVTATLAVQGIFANFADLACMVSQLWSDPGRDWREVRNSMRDMGCGLGDELRTNMVAEHVRAARQGSAIVPRTAAPDTARMPSIAPPAAPRSSVVAAPAQQTPWVQCPSRSGGTLSHKDYVQVRLVCEHAGVSRLGGLWLDCGGGDTKPFAKPVNAACALMRPL